MARPVCRSYHSHISLSSLGLHSRQAGAEHKLSTDTEPALRPTTTAPAERKHSTEITKGRKENRRFHHEVIRMDFVVTDVLQDELILAIERNPEYL